MNRELKVEVTHRTKKTKLVIASWVVGCLALALLLASITHRVMTERGIHEVLARGRGMTFLFLDIDADTIHTRAEVWANYRQFSTTTAYFTNLLDGIRLLRVPKGYSFSPLRASYLTTAPMLICSNQKTTHGAWSRM